MSPRLGGRLTFVALYVPLRQPIDERVTRTEDFAPALARALGAGRAAVLELVVDPEAITTRTTLSAIRAAAEARREEG